MKTIYEIRSVETGKLIQTIKCERSKIITSTSKPFRIAVGDVLLGFEEDVVLKAMEDFMTEVYVDINNSFYDSLYESLRRYGVDETLADNLASECCDNYCEVCIEVNVSPKGGEIEILGTHIS